MKSPYKPSLQVSGPIVIGISLTESKTRVDGRYRIVTIHPSVPEMSGVFAKTTKNLTDKSVGAPAGSTGTCGSRRK